MRQAMALVKEEHGNDAVILSTKDVSGGVEIVAALDPEANQYQQQKNQQNPHSNSYSNSNHGYEASRNNDNRFSQEGFSEPYSEQPYGSMPKGMQGATRQPGASYQNYDSGLAQTPGDFNHASQTGSGYAHQVSTAQNAQNQNAPGLAQIASELSDVKSMLESQLSGLAWQQTEQSDPYKVQLIKKLVQLGIGWDLSESKVAELKKVNSFSWGVILDELENEICIEEQDIIEQGGVVALVGPTGVGKTTTIAKIASRFVMRNSPNDIAIISTDTYKIGAQAQLQHFADIINVPIHVAGTQGELYALLTSLVNKKLVLIDTAGMSQRDLQLSQQITSCHQGDNLVRNYLVLSAATQRSVLNDIVNSFSQVVLQGCILTKVDEALQLGNVLTVLIEKQLPIAYMSNGQRVPEDLEKVRAKELMDKAIFLGQKNSNSNENEQAFQLGMGREISNAQ